jgi:hypothetical protein
MELGLTNEQKLQSLNGLKTRIKTEMYSLLLSLGIDPDTFDPEAWVRPETASPSADRFARLVECIETLDLVDTKIIELA